VLIANTDDHLRNHGFLYQPGRGWRLSPAYDLNPTPADVPPRVLSTPINEVETEASFEVAFRVAGYLGLEATDAKAAH
jgi:serine/threonine-protein kinase HipA